MALIACRITLGPCGGTIAYIEISKLFGFVRAVRAIAADYVVIDTAPDASTMIAPIALANVTVVPCTPTGLDIETRARTIEIVRKVRRTIPEKQCFIVPNRVDARTLEGRQFVEELERLGERISPSVGSRVAFVRAFSAGQSISAFEPGGLASSEVRELCNVLVRPLNPPSAPEQVKR
jgi:chromosome partitioning protein